MSLFKKSQNPLIALVTELLAAAGIERGGEAIAGHVVGKLNELKQNAGADQGSQDLVVNSEVNFNDLSNQIHSMLAAAGIPENQMPGIFTDPQQLFEYFRSNYSVNAKQDLNDILSSLSQLLQSIPESFFKSDPKLIQEIFDFTFKFYKRSNYSKQAITGKLQEYSQQFGSGDPFQQLIAVQQIEGNFLGAAMMSFLNGIGKDNPQLEDVIKISGVAQKMLGAQSPELLDAQALNDAKNKSTFDYLKESKDLFRLMTPIAEEKERFKQDMYSHLSSIFGSPAAKEIVNGPLGSFLILSYGFKEGVSGLTGGASSALKGR